MSLEYARATEFSLSMDREVAKLDVSSVMTLCLRQGAGCTQQDGVSRHRIIYDGDNIVSLDQYESIMMYIVVFIILSRDGIHHVCECLMIVGKLRCIYAMM